MASFIRVGIINFMRSGSGAKTLLTQKSMSKTSSVRCISSKIIRERHPVKKPKPWDYENKNFGVINYFFDKTSARFDENSKIVVVEGPIAAGKSAFAKQLAEELDMLYLPEANLDMIYINQYGYDLRKLDEQLPPDCRSFDVNNFLMSPKHKLVASFQIRQYNVRFSQYVDALAHVFSTGQGVVLDRSPYSDFVFVETMYSQGYLSKAAKSFYYEIRKNTLPEILRPHLVIYLDIPVEKVKENIKKRNIPYEVKSQVLNDNYLNTMEKVYKQQYLKQISQHAELLIYDWSCGGDSEVVVEDIERIEFKRADDNDTKLSDWVFHTEEEMGVARSYYADKKDLIMNHFNVPRYDVSEMIIDAEDAKLMFDILNEAPGNKFDKGFNANMGDKNILFKIKDDYRDTLPRRERRVHY